MNSNLDGDLKRLRNYKSPTWANYDFETGPGSNFGRGDWGVSIEPVDQTKLLEKMARAMAMTSHGSVNNKPEPAVAKVTRSHNIGSALAELINSDLVD